MSAPPKDTVERWAWDFVHSTVLDEKLSPPTPPSAWAEVPQHWQVSEPGRPPELVPRQGRKKPQRPGGLRDAAKRAEVLHTFLHHELQAAELMAWAILTFPQTPEAFRRGLLNICRDELRHMQLYSEHLVTLGCPFGTHPIKDWFWQRVPEQDMSPAHFVARLGIAFEGGNLDHGARFTEYFKAAGDLRAAAIQEQITQEEVAHTAFGLHWFRVFTGGEVGFDAWRSHLPAVISPIMARGIPLNWEARRRAGFSESFLESLAGWSPADHGQP